MTTGHNSGCSKGYGDGPLSLVHIALPGARSQASLSAYDNSCSPLAVALNSCSADHLEGRLLYFRSTAVLSIISSLPTD